MALWFDGLVCDLDGVVYRGDIVVAGAPEAVESLRRAGVRIVFCTNNSTATVAQYRRKLAAMGIDAAPDDVLTSAVVTAEVLRARGLAGSGAVVLGGEGLSGALDDIGVRPATDPEAADVVVVGLDYALTYDKLLRATLALRAGARFVATNTDATLPAPGGALWPGAGAIVAALQASSGRAPEVMGKPHRAMMDAAERRLQGARRIAVVGDRPDTDLAGGAARGWSTVLVLSGVTTGEEAAALRPAPDAVLASLADLRVGDQQGGDRC